MAGVGMDVLQRGFNSFGRLAPFKDNTQRALKSDIHPGCPYAIFTQDTSSRLLEGHGSLV